MQKILVGLLAGFLAACSTAPANPSPLDVSPVQNNGGGPGESALNEVQFVLQDLGPAPELNNTVWLNTPQPLRLAGLRGKVVLLEMWTFLCINCLDVVPALKNWEQTYSPQGLVIVANHYPEFDYERDLGNLKDAIAREGITYPVTQDNDGQTWSAYHNHYWPAIYLIDKAGHLRYRHIGEGSYDLIEAAIQTLLAETYP